MCSKTYDILLALSKAHLAANPSIARRVEAEEVANTAWINLSTGRGGSKEDGDLRYAILVACDPRRKDNVYLRGEGIYSAYEATAAPFEDVADKRTAEFETDVCDAIDSLPDELAQAIRCEMYGDTPNKYDLLAGQKAMRDIYDRN